MTVSTLKRKRNVVAIETKLEVIDQPAKRVSSFSWAVRYNIGRIIQLPKKNQISKQPPISISLNNQRSIVYVNRYAGFLNSCHFCLYGIISRVQSVLAHTINLQFYSAGKAV